MCNSHTSFKIGKLLCVSMNREIYAGNKYTTTARNDYLSLCTLLDQFPDLDNLMGQFNEAFTFFQT